MGISHLDDAPAGDIHVGHLKARWSFLGEAAGSVAIGARRLQIEPGSWSTPAHEHGAEEEIFYILSGSGIVWQKKRVSPIRAGDCLVFLPRAGAHTVRADEPLDLIAFGPRIKVESVGFPRLDMNLISGRAVESGRGGIDGRPIQFVREAEIGPPEVPEELGERPSTTVNVADVEGQALERPRVKRVRRDLARAAGSVATGLVHVEVAPGMEATAQHCHSVEEELFVVLDGAGALLLGDEEIPVRAGSIVARPAGTGVAHTFRAGEDGLTFLAYGTRDNADICWYPRSNKVAFRGIKVIARVEKLDYWDGED